MPPQLYKGGNQVPLHEQSPITEVSVRSFSHTLCRILQTLSSRVEHPTRLAESRAAFVVQSLFERKCQ